jgi:DNA-binding PucR family transcriptional regulator
MEEEAPTRDAEYLRGLREAVARGVDYGISLLEDGMERGPQVPLALVVQARLAARQGIPLEMVMRRYMAGKALICDSILREATAIGASSSALLREALATQEAAFDRLLATVSEEYGREEQQRRKPGDSQLLERIRRLLAGELVDSSVLNYDLDRHHLAIVSGSPEAREAIRQLATETNSRHLIVNADHGEVWAWLGRKEAFDTEVVSRFVADASSPSMPMALGEPARSCSGWRLTHRQAQAAFSVAQVSPAGFARFAAVAMVVGAAESPLLATSLQRLYLSPLQGGGNKSTVLRETLRAYFSADRNSKSAGHALGVARQTVANRLEQVEARIGQPLSMCADAVDAALRMEELGLLDSSLDIV